MYYIQLILSYSPQSKEQYNIYLQESHMNNDKT